MTVELIRGTEKPEKLVAIAARNDYRSDGVIGHSFSEIMDGAALNKKHVDDIILNDVFGDGNEETEEVRLEAKKRTLISHLMDHGHWGPLEHPSATIALEGVTRVSMAQITRHRHFTFDIMSLRYVEVEDVDDVEDRFQIPEVVKEGEAVDREGVHKIDDDAEEKFIEAYEDCIDHYRSLLDSGVPQEEARKVLPMGTKVNIVMSGNARAWLHLLNIRGKADVQGEARRLADGIFDELEDWMPFTMEQFDEQLPMTLNP